MARLAPQGLALKPMAFFTHAQDFCLVYRHCAAETYGQPDASLARLLARVHTAPGGAISGPAMHSGPQAQLLDRAIEMLRAKTVTRPLGSLIADTIAQYTAPQRTVLLHGDPVPGNVLWRPRGPLLIDWQCAQSGDPCHDLAIATSPAMLTLHGQVPLTMSQKAAFLRGYGAPDIAARCLALAPLFHAQMIAHCLWRLEAEDAAYDRPMKAEIAALQGLADEGVKQRSP
jgi:aminoglycoside phosphotransferase (APT) family kinase protein